MPVARRLQNQKSRLEVDIKAGPEGVLVLEQPSWLVWGQ